MAEAIAALDARAVSVAKALRLAMALKEPASSEKAARVAKLAGGVASRMGLPAGESSMVKVAASVQDVGRLAVPDELLAKHGPLNPQEWQQLRGHTVAAAALLHNLPELRPVAPIVRATHERWDGEGYPDGMAGDDIPLVSRILSACDAYVAMTSVRPFRPAMDEATALGQLAEVAGRQVDPRVVDAVAEEVTGRRPSSTAATKPAAAEPNGKTGAAGLIAQLEAAIPIPALQISRDRVLEALRQPQPSENDVIAQIEVDPGLAIQVLRAANGQRAVITLPEVITALGYDELRRVVEEAPALDYVWPQNSWETALERFRLHAVAVQRAALRLAESAGFEALDALSVLALLHDVGRIALGQVHRDYEERTQEARSPEQRLRLERRLLGLDHATVGGIVARQWGLPEQLAEGIGRHHDETASMESTLLVIADALAHHTQGKAPLSARTLRLSYSLDLAPGQLRAITFELPHSDGSRRMRAEPCPLSKRELAAVRGLAEGKVDAQVGEDLGIHVSTIRTHLHNACSKLGVANRAQAVLLATERGWL